MRSNQVGQIIQEKDKKFISINIPNNTQKSSMISMYSKGETKTTYSPKAPVFNRDSLSSNQYNNQINKFKPQGEKRQSNISVDEQQYSKNFSNMRNGKVSFNISPNQIKQVRQSENAGVHKTPPNSLNQKRLINSKSATTLPNALNGKDQQVLHIRHQNAGLNILDDYQTEQARQLKVKIQEALAVNENIQKQITQLKYKKLILNSTPTQIIQLKAQINELKSKIKKIKDETAKKQQNFYEYYAQKKNLTTTFTKDEKNMSSAYQKVKPYQNEKYHTLSRIPSTDFSYGNQKLTTVMSNPYLTTTNPSTDYKQRTPLYSPTLTKSRIQIENKMKRSSLPNEVRQIKFSGSGPVNSNSNPNESGNYYRGIKYSDGPSGRI